MNFITKLSTFLLIFVSMLLLQSNHFFEIGGIVPNLILVGFLILSLTQKENLKFIIFVGIGLVAVTLLWFPFWVWGVILAFVFGIILTLVNNFLSGNIFIDFFFSIIVFTVLFYGIFYFAGLSSFIWIVVLGELLYNMALGVLFLLVNRF